MARKTFDGWLKPGLAVTIRFGEYSPEAQEILKKCLPCDQTQCETCWRKPIKPKGRKKSAKRTG